MPYTQRFRFLRAALCLVFVLTLSLEPFWPGAAIAEEANVTPLLTDASNALWIDNDTLILMGERNGEYGTYQITFGETIHYKRLFSSPYVYSVRKIGKEEVLFMDKSRCCSVFSTDNTPFHVYNVRTGVTSMGFHGSTSDQLFHFVQTNTIYFRYPFKKHASFKVGCEPFTAVPINLWAQMATDGINFYAVTDDEVLRFEGLTIVEKFRIDKYGLLFLKINNAISAKGRFFIKGSFEFGDRMLYVCMHGKGCAELFSASRIECAYAEEEDKLYVSLGGKAVFKEDGAGGMVHVINLDDSYWLYSPSPQGDKLLVMNSHVVDVHGGVRSDANIRSFRNCRG